MKVHELINILQRLDQDKEIYCTEAAFQDSETQKVGSVELEPLDINGREVYMIYGDNV